MKAKEKAKELLAKMHTPHSLWNEAKMCSLVAVDEIVLALTEYGDDSDGLQNMDGEFRWWDEVKQEINKL